MEQKNEIEIYIPGDPNPPTVTQQQHRVFVRNGKPIFIPSEKLREAKELFAKELAKYKGTVHFTRPIYVKVIWIWQYRKDTKKSLLGKVLPKDKRPDIDNLSKALLDEITKAGIICDDSIIARLCVEKCWYDKPGIYIRIIELDQEMFEKSVLKRVDKFTASAWQRQKDTENEW